MIWILKSSKFSEHLTSFPKPFTKGYHTQRMNDLHFPSPFSSSGQYLWDGSQVVKQQRGHCLRKQMSKSYNLIHQCHPNKFDKCLLKRSSKRRQGGKDYPQIKAVMSNCRSVRVLKSSNMKLDNNLKIQCSKINGYKSPPIWWIRMQCN